MLFPFVSLHQECNGQLYLYFSQKYLPLKMKPRLVITEYVRVITEYVRVITEYVRVITEYVRVITEYVRGVCTF